VWLLLAWVFVGTLARQVVTYGENPNKRAPLGDDQLVLTSLVERGWPALAVLAVLTLLIAARSRVGDAVGEGG
jgi:hypothetical protein